MSISSSDQSPDVPATLEEWSDIDCQHAQLQERVNRYVDRLNRKRDYLEQYVAVLTAMLDSIGDGLIVCDADGNLALINEAAEKLIGKDIPTRVEDPWSDDKYGLFYADTLTPIKEEDKPLRKALLGQHVETVFFGRASQLPDGGWFRVHATPVMDKAGILHGAIVVFHDITEARKASRQRDTLSALITHDLKNHLLGESQLLQMLIDGELGLLNEKQTNLLIRIDRESKRQFQTTNSLVEILRYDVRSHGLHFVDTSITALVDTCVEEILPSVETSELTLETNFETILPSVLADETALRQVLINLLGNAIKFTDSGGTIKIETRDLGDEISISVSDTGPGMSDADLHLLFTDSWPGTKPYLKPGSSGLGLYLCAKIVHAHRGRITCSTELGVGTTFKVILPAAKAKGQ